MAGERGWSQPKSRPRREAPAGVAARPRPPAERPPGQWPVVLLLVGAQGSGKSTLADELVRLSAAPWTRVSQDVLGSRPRCLKAAAEALGAGRSVVVDRCNFDATQRSGFIAVAKESGCPTIALVLDLPLETCLSRAVGRKGHEGGIEGQMAEKVVRITRAKLKRAGIPRQSEGIDAVTVCKTPEMVQRELRRWVEWAPRASPPKRSLEQEPQDASPGPPGSQDVDDLVSDVSRLALAPAK